MRFSSYKKILAGLGILVAIFLLAYFSSTTFSNKVNNHWNGSYSKLSGIFRNYYLSHVSDESPGVGPGNKQIIVKDAQHFSFAVLGDTQNFELPADAGSYADAVGQVEKMKPDLVMTVGDLVQSCGATIKCNDYKLWKNIAKPILPITYEVVGNHDRIVGNSDDTKKAAADQQWQNYFTLPTNGPAGYSELTYSFNVGNSHFIVLDSEKPAEHEIGPDQLSWLETDLESNQQQNTFIFYHEPAFPMSYKIGQSLDYHAKQRDALWSIIDKFNVTAVFNGHEHIYSRQLINQNLFPAATHTINQFIIGNTDAYEKQNIKISSSVPYYHEGYNFCMVYVDGTQITVKLFSVDGTLVDSYTFQNK